MIESLRIRELAIVEGAELEFAPGLNVVTGETGAGKSVVLGALALLAGARASAKSVRSGADEAAVEAVFRTEALPELEAELVQRGLEGDDHELIVRRSLSAAGRSRAWLGGGLVPIAALTELFQGRIEISSQHDSQALLRTDHHGELLDRWAGLEALRGELAEEIVALRAALEERERLSAATREREQRRDFLSYQVSEINEAKLDVDEEEGLRALRSRLAHADRIGRDGGAALAGLAGDPRDPEGAGAADRLAESARGLRELARLDPALAPLAERADGALAELRELASDLERQLEGLEDDPARLAQTEERLHRIEGLQRKYGATVVEVLTHRDTAAVELEALEGADAREAELDAAIAAHRERASALAGKLSAGREKAAGELSAAVEPALRELAMPDARFGVALRPAAVPEGLPCAAGGAEVPEFSFSANAGEAPRPLRQVASGGELSRAFLALKQCLREGTHGMVLVFDEVDAGVGGEAADRVGLRLAELARRHQVLCITHLPQIAAYAQRHFRVRKGGGKRRATVRIDVLEADERVDELARMAGGDRAGKAAREYARELLATRGGA